MVTEQNVNTASNLKTMMRIRDLSPDLLSSKTGVAVPAIKCYMRGNAEIAVNDLEPICKALGITRGDLCGGKPIRPLGEELKGLRENEGLSAQEAADMLHLHLTTVYGLEHATANSGSLGPKSFAAYKDLFQADFCRIARIYELEKNISLPGKKGNKAEKEARSKSLTASAVCTAVTAAEKKKAAIVGQNVKMLMRTKHFTVRDISYKCGLDTNQAVMGLINGDVYPRQSFAIKLADALGTTVPDLYRDPAEDEPAVPKKAETDPPVVQAPEPVIVADSVVPQAELAKRKQKPEAVPCKGPAPSHEAHPDPVPEVRKAMNPETGPARKPEAKPAQKPENASVLKPEVKPETSTEKPVPVASNADAAFSGVWLTLLKAIRDDSEFRAAATAILDHIVTGKEMPDLPDMPQANLIINYVRQDCVK